MTCDHESIVKALLGSYEEIGGINHLDGTNLPSKAAIPGICEDLLGLLFPGFLDEEAMSSACVQRMTEKRIERVASRLELELGRSLRCRPKEQRDADCDSKAASLTCHFLRQIPAVRTLLHTDVKAAFDGDPAARSYEEIILSYPCIEAIAIQRLAHVLYREDVPLLPRMMTEWAHSRTGIDIHPGAEIGSHFFIDHGTGVVVGETCVIGAHVKLYQGVGLVARSLAAGQALKGTRRHPTIEDHVTIYANATIVGGDTIIGAGSTIGASVFLMQSVPPASVVALGDQELRILDKKTKKASA